MIIVQGAPASRDGTPTTTARRSEWFSGRSGNRLHAVGAGDGAAVCLLLHGFGEGAYIWDELIDDLAGLGRVVALDLRGHGNSDWASNGDYGIDHYVADVVQVVSAMKAERLVVIGHSLGASVGAILAASLPHVIVGLALLDYSPEPAREILDLVHGNFASSRLQSFATAAAYEAHLLDTRPMLTPAKAHKLAISALTPNDTGQLALKSDPDIVHGRSDISETSIQAAWCRLRTLEMPTIIVRGQASAMLSAATADRMAAEIPLAKLATVRRAGHSLMSDNPLETRALVYDFVCDRFGTSAGPPGACGSLVTSAVCGD